ncbi:hypothetical protein Tco_0157505 [Tanacetum coccineum]
MQIPNWMLIEEMKQTKHYQLYVFVFRVDVPTTQSQSIKSTQGMHRTLSALRTPNPVTTQGESSAPHKPTVIRFCNVEKVQEHLVDEEIKTMVEGTKNVDKDEFTDEIFNDQEDLGTRLATRCHKESLEVKKSVDVLIINNDEDEEESARDEFILRRREKGKRIEEIRDKPPTTPIRSPRTHIAPLSSDKETL